MEKVTAFQKIMNSIHNQYNNLVKKLFTIKCMQQFDNYAIYNIVKSLVTAVAALNHISGAILYQHNNPVFLLR